MTSHIHSPSKLRYEDYARIPDDGQRHEIIDGEHYVNAAPNTYHQTLSKRLQYELYRQVELRGLGLLFGAPFDVQLSEYDVVQPDLVVLLGDNQQRVTPSRVIGVPDLLVEITSPSSTTYDRQLKKALYARAGVPEYWLVDARLKVLEQWLLEAGQYRAERPIDQVRAHVCPQVVIPLSGLW